MTWDQSPVVIVIGFLKDTEEKDVYDVLLKAGLPDNYKISDIKKN